MTAKKLHADTNHAFVQAVKQYVEEGLLEEEFKRRARVFAAKQSGHQEHASIGSASHGGGRPNLTADETRELANNIIEGRTVPEPVTIYNLGVQFGFIRKQLTDFYNLGGEYLRHCAERAEGARPMRQEVFPEGETLKEALTAILGTRRYGRRANRLFAPGDVGYDGSGTTQASPAEAFDIVFKGHIDRYRNFNDQIPLKAAVEGTVECKWESLKDPYSRLLAPEDIQELADKFHLTSYEQQRLVRAHENVRMRMDELCSPAAQEREIKHILSLYQDKQPPYKEEGAAKLVLLDILRVRGDSVSWGQGGRARSYRKGLSPSTLIFCPPDDTPQDKREEAVAGLITEHNLGGFEGIWQLAGDMIGVDAAVLRAANSASSITAYKTRLSQIRRDGGTSGPAR